MVAGIDRFLLRETEKSNDGRGKFWKRDFSSAEDYNKTIDPTRQQLAQILGVRDQRVNFEAPELMATVNRPALLLEKERYTVYAIRWPAVRDVWGEGLLLMPKKAKPIASVVAIPDARQSPEQIAGVVGGTSRISQFARRLAESGCRVIVPVLIDRKVEARNGRAKLSSREFLYRPSFELGRHLIGYEIQKVLAAVDWLSKDDPNVGVIGYAEGGMLALYSAALDPRIKSTCVSAYFSDRRSMWQEPIDRNVFGLLEQFGDAEIASMIAPRAVTIEGARGPQITVGGDGRAPGELWTPEVDTIRKEVNRAPTPAGDFAGGMEI